MEAQPSIVKPATSSELGRLVPHETNADVFGYERPEPTGPATSATSPAPVPSLPEPDASAGEVAFMCQTPL